LKEEWPQRTQRNQRKAKANFFQKFFGFFVFFVANFLFCPAFFEPPF